LRDVTELGKNGGCSAVDYGVLLLQIKPPEYGDCRRNTELRDGTSRDFVWLWLSIFINLKSVTRSETEEPRGI
jgi:hypothetical protein